jgi:sarcosine oxidase subunit alpha
LRILQARGPRQRLVGIELDADAPLPKECHLVIEHGTIGGRITSVTHSRTLNKSIGLAMLSPHLAEPGRRIEIRGDDGKMVSARVVPAPFYDPKNLRQKAEAGA